MGQNDYGSLFEPIRIGGIEVKNRILQCAMDPGPFVLDGKFNERNANILTERACGGVGLIVSGCTLVERGDGTLFDSDREVFIPGARKMTDEIHSYGSKVFLQLSAGVGRNLQITKENAAEAPAVQMVAPSDNTPNVFVPEVKHQGMTKEHIEHLISGFAKAACVAKEAGFDGIEVHALHEGYLLDQFSIGSINRRQDEYGGSLENRLRFAEETLHAIKEACGKDYPVIIRFSVESKMKGWNKGRLPGDPGPEFGRDRKEAVQAAKLLEQMGYDALNADNGSYDAWYWAHPPMYMEQMCNLEDAAFIRRNIEIPVYCAGRMDNPGRAADAVRDGMVDGIALGRALLADPKWPDKVRDGKVDDIRPCIACQAGCLRTFLGQSMTCALNPRLGQRNEDDYGTAEKIRKVAVVGGGIGGMEAARVLKKRGHQVTLFEKTNVLGGVFIAAAAPEFKEADKKLLSWYRKQMADLEIDVRLNTAVDPDMLRNYDIVMTATGSHERRMSIDGVPEEKLLTAIDVLLERKPIGNRVLIIGGGLTGCEIAYDMAKKGKAVTVVEMLPDILTTKGLCRANSDMLRELLKQYGVGVLTGTNMERMERGIAVLNTSNGEKTVPVDTVVMAIGYMPDDSLYRELREQEIPAVNIGDSLRIGNLLSVIEQAQKAACMV